jgi:hypothetical protein
VHSFGKKVLTLWLCRRRREEGGDAVVCYGMEARIVCATEPGRYMGSFSNLGYAVEVDSYNLQVTQKVEREEHFCVCGNGGTFICGRYSRKWYRSKIRRGSDQKTHKATCKALVLTDPMTEMMRVAKIAEEKTSTDE